MHPTALAFRLANTPRQIVGYRITLTFASVTTGPNNCIPANAVCEGQITTAGLGWTLWSDYPARAEQPLKRAQQSASLTRALSLLGGSWVSAAGLASGWEVQLCAGSAPRLISSAENCESAAPTLALSHSGNLLLAAAAEPGHQLGVDVERLRDRDFQRLETHMDWRAADQLLPGSVQEIERKLLFYRRWTLAESLYKALGIVNLECFTALENLAPQNITAWDTGWRRTSVRAHSWDVRWWRVGALQQAALVCLLRGVGDRPAGDDSRGSAL